jgi:transcriptional regulator with XRE-family HTH domain
MKSIEYIEKVKSKLNLETYVEVAEKLHTTKQNINSVKNGRSTIDGDSILWISKILELPITKVIFDIKAEKARTPEAKKEWSALSKEASKDSRLYIMLSTILD